MLFGIERVDELLLEGQENPQRERLSKTTSCLDNITESIAGNFAVRQACMKVQRNIRYY
jgi:hypothetical protein